MSTAELEYSLFSVENLDFKITAEEDDGPPYPKPEEEPEEGESIETEESDDEDDETDVDAHIRMEEEDEAAPIPEDEDPYDEDSLVLSAIEGVVIKMRRLRPVSPPVPVPHELPPIYDQKDMFAA